MSFLPCTTLKETEKHCLFPVLYKSALQAQDISYKTEDITFPIQYIQYSGSRENKCNEIFFKVPYNTSDKEERKISIYIKNIPGALFTLPEGHLVENY